jgi:hypothetical protein
MNTNSEVIEIINKYITQNQVGRSRVMAFASAMGVSKASVSMWRRGKTIPALAWLLDLRVHFNDWRFDFATELINAMFPEIGAQLSPKDGNGHLPAIQPVQAHMFEPGSCDD